MTELERMRDRIERLRGMLKTCAGWFRDLDRNQCAEHCLWVAGDMEAPLDHIEDVRGMVEPVAEVVQVNTQPFPYDNMYGAQVKSNERLSVGAELYASPPVREGWKMVPIEPTKEMMEAAFRGFMGEKEQWNSDNWDSSFSIGYKAMLEAAP